MKANYTKENTEPQDGFSKIIWKKRSETLAELVVRFKKENKLDSTSKVTYAGRLDPMAEGFVLMLTEEKCKQKEFYLKSPKAYKFEILFGFSTDTGDVLGLVENENFKKSEEIIEFDDAIEKIINTRYFQYPAFSSKPYLGTPLFVHAKNKTLPGELPAKEGRVYELKLVKSREVGFKELMREIITDIEEVKGDFRQAEIEERWQNVLKKTQLENVRLYEFEAVVSSGVYIRELASMIGRGVGRPCLCYSITRTAYVDTPLDKS